MKHKTKIKNQSRDKSNKKKNQKTLYGVFAGANITDKDIDEVTKSWDRYVDKLVHEP